ncbi:ABC transporter substrate-binding protein, partial [Paenibacillus sp. TAF58]
MKKYLKTSLLIATAITVIAGCESTPASQNPVAEKSTKAPANEMFIYTVYPAFYAKEENYEKQIGQYLKKKFPDISFKHVHWDNPGRQYKDLIAA